MQWWVWVIIIGVIVIGAVVIFSRRREELSMTISLATPQMLPPAAREILPELQDLARRNRMGMAIKRLQETSGWTRDEAREYIEALARDLRSELPSSPPVIQPEPPAERPVPSVAATQRKTTPAKAMPPAPVKAAIVAPTAPPEQSPAPKPRAATVPEATLAEVLDLMRRGRKIEAIKRLREATSWGLKESKDYVEALDLSTSVLMPEPKPRAATVPAEALAEVRDSMRRGRKIEAIKRLREATNWGLKEAKDYVESLVLDAPEPPATPSPLSLTDAIPADVIEELRTYKRRGSPIPAIKRLREITGWGLKEAKEYVDQL